MKRILLFAAVALCLCSCGKKAETGYRINVEFKGDLSGQILDTVYLLKPAGVVDTALVADGKACFEGNMQTPDEVILYGKSFGKKGRQVLFFLENCENNVVLTFSKGGITDVKIEGGEYQRFYDSLVSARRNIHEKRNFSGVLGAYRASKDEAEKAKLLEIWKSISRERDSICKAMEDEYMANNPLSQYALVHLFKNVENFSDAELEARIAAFKAVPEFVENKKLKQIEQAAAQLKAVRVGNKVADFIQNDPQGNPVKFSDIYSKNKLTMVDFWASWCGPCRAFNPTLMKIYEKYHDKGFEVLGVSYDSNKDAWVKCIESEKLPWLQVSDLKGWGNATANMFYIKGIPQNLFVDQNGTIIGYKVNRNTIEQFIKEQLEK